MIFCDDGVDALRKGWAQGSPSQKLWQQLVADNMLTSAFILADDPPDAYDFAATCWLSSMVPSKHNAACGHLIQHHLLPAVCQTLRNQLSHQDAAAMAKHLLRREMQALLSTHLSFRV